MKWPLPATNEIFQFCPLLNCTNKTKVMFKECIYMKIIRVKQQIEHKLQEQFSHTLFLFSCNGERQWIFSRIKTIQY